MLTETPFYFVRHGETDWNRINRIQGHIDIPLSDVGRDQARIASAAFAGAAITAIYSSPLARALQTAEFFQSVLGCPLHRNNDLMEVNLGARQGTSMGPWYEDWKAGKELPDGAESYRGFIGRALRGITQALGHPGPVLIVAHGVVYRAIKQYAGLDPKFSLPNCVVVRHDPPDAFNSDWRMVLDCLAPQTQI